MSIKSKVLAAAATLTLVGGVGAAGALTAGSAAAATPSCGPACVNLFSYQFGTHATPNYTVDVLRQGEKVGQPIILFRTANYDPALDWTFSFQGTVADFFAAGLVSSAVALHYGCIAPDRPQLPELPVQRHRVQHPVRATLGLPGGGEPVLAVRRGVGSVHGRGRDRVQRRGRDAAAVWRVVQDGVDPGHP